MSELSAKEFKAALIIIHHALKTNTLEINGKIKYINKEKIIKKKKQIGKMEMIPDGNLGHYK